MRIPSNHCPQILGRYSGYIQHWWGQGNPIPERSAQRIFKAADQILKAGTTGAQ